MRHLMGISIVVLTIALPMSAHAQDWFRLSMDAPILYGEVTNSDGTPDVGGSTPIEILAEAQHNARMYGAVSIAVVVTGIDASYSVEVTDLPSDATWTGNAIHWSSATEGAYTPTIEVRDTNDELVASRGLELIVYPMLVASVTQSSYEVEVGDALTVAPTASNAIGDLQWGRTPSELPEWLDFDAITGAIVVDTSMTNSLGDIVLTAVDQADMASASTIPFSIAVNGAETEYWIATFGGSGNDVGYSSAIGPDGSLYVVGSTNSAGAGGTDALIAKFDATGALQWQRTLGGSGSDSGHSIAVGPDGSVYTAGSTSSAGAGGTDFFLVKHDSSGALQWQRTYGGTGTDNGYSVAIGSDGSVYVGGRTTSVGAGGFDSLLAKYDASGSLQWQRRIGGNGNDQIKSIAIGADGAVYAGGMTRSGAAAGDDFLIVKYNAEGALQWSRALGGAGNDQIESVAIGPDGSLYAVGFTHSAGAGGADSLLAKFDTDGAVQWQRALGGSNTDYGNSVFIGPDGSVNVAGYTQSVGAGGTDILLAGYDAAGSLQWQRTLGGTGGDTSQSLAFGSDGSVYVQGVTSSAGAGSNDFMVARLPKDGGENMIAGPLVYQSSDLISQQVTLEFASPIVPIGTPNLSSSSSPLSEGIPSLSDTTSIFRMQ